MSTDTPALNPDICMQQ